MDSIYKSMIGMYGNPEEEQSSEAAGRMIVLLTNHLRKIDMLEETSKVTRRDL